MRGISWLAANRLASQEGLCTMEWVSKFSCYSWLNFTAYGWLSWSRCLVDYCTKSVLAAVGLWWRHILVLQPARLVVVPGWKWWKERNFCLAILQPIYCSKYGHAVCSTSRHKMAIFDTCTEFPIFCLSFVWNLVTFCDVAYCFFLWKYWDKAADFVPLPQYCKPYSCLFAPCHEPYRGGKVPLVDVGIRWMWAVSITLRSLYFRAVMHFAADSHWTGRLAGLNEVMGKNPFPFRASNPGCSFCRQCH